MEGRLPRCSAQDPHEVYTRLGVGVLKQAPRLPTKAPFVSGVHLRVLHTPSSSKTSSFSAHRPSTTLELASLRGSHTLHDSALPSLSRAVRLLTLRLAQLQGAGQLLPKGKT